MSERRLGPPFDEFEQEGERVVRHNLEANLYNSGKAASARAWLGRKDDAREQRTMDAEAEQLAIARSAKDAAWASATAAQASASEAAKANRRALHAMIIAAVSAGAAVAASVVAYLALAASR